MRLAAEAEPFPLDPALQAVITALARWQARRDWAEANSPAVAGLSANAERSIGGAQQER